MDFGIWRVRIVTKKLYNLVLNFGCPHNSNEVVPTGPAQRGDNLLVPTCFHTNATFCVVSLGDAAPVGIRQNLYDFRQLVLVLRYSIKRL